MNLLTLNAIDPETTEYQGLALLTYSDSVDMGRNFVLMKNGFLTDKNGFVIDSSPQIVAAVYAWRNRRSCPYVADRYVGVGISLRHTSALPVEEMRRRIAELEKNPDPSNPASEQGLTALIDYMTKEPMAKPPVAFIYDHYKLHTTDGTLVANRSNGGALTKMTALPGITIGVRPSKPEQAVVAVSARLKELVVG